jgi:hypothetical protein
METIKTKNSEIWVEEDILIIRMSGELLEEEVEEIKNIGFGLVEKLKLKYVIVDSDVKQMPLKAREKAFDIYQGTSVEKIAFVSKNSVTRIIASFLIKRYAPSTPTKLFANSEEAKKWFRPGTKIKN